MQHTVASLYNNMIKKTPSVFGMIYKLGDIYSSTRLPSPVYWANAQYAQALRSYILDHGFDAVLCTHLYGMEVMTAIRQDPAFTIPCCGVLTDYINIPFIDETRLDRYFVPHEGAKQELSSKGIDPDRISISGIPVDHVFSQHMDQASARTELKMPLEKSIFLVMTGGIGCENMLGLCDELLRSPKADRLVYVLTGKNDDLKRRLDEKYSTDSRLRTVAFTKKVAVYMAASDVLLTKPGGLSSTEAAVANIPMVHIHAIPGCETYNAKFFRDRGMSMHAKDDKQAVQFAELLADNPDAAAHMRLMQRKHIPQDAADRIIEEMNHP